MPIEILEYTDSAASELISLRNPSTQGVMPLRGKVRNTFNLELADALKNKEVKDIITALGCGAGSTCNTKNLRYDRIIIASDADAK